MRRVYPYYIYSAAISPATNCPPAKSPPPAAIRPPLAYNSMSINVYVLTYSLTTLFAAIYTYLALLNTSWLPGFARAPPSLPASLSLSPIPVPSLPSAPHSISILGGGLKQMYRFSRQFMKLPGRLIC